MSLTDAIGRNGKKHPSKNEGMFSAHRPNAGKYAAAAFESEVRSVAEASEGERNATLNRAAFALGQLVGAGALDETTVANALSDAARHAGLGETEIGKTIASGLESGKREPREIPEPRAKSDNMHTHNAVQEPPEWLDDGPEPTDDGAPDAPPKYDNVNADNTVSANDGKTPPPERRGWTPAEVLSLWRDEGPLIHEPTGIAGLDELTGGGPVYGTRWYLSGSPDAGKTALLIQIADIYAQRGITVGLLAVDEEASDLVTRLAQRRGWSRWHCEIRDGGVITSMSDAMGGLPLRFYDESWTIETAAQDLSRYAAERGDSRIVLGIDSVQTVQCSAEYAAEREMSEVQAVTARSRAIRAVATRYRAICIATSELGRAAYRSSDPSQQTATLAAAKWSGAIEYSARVLIGLRSVAGETDLIDLELAKNKHGPRSRHGDPTTAHVFLRIDRASQMLSEAGYAPPPEPTQQDRDERARTRARHDAAVVATVLIERPGIGTRDLRAAVRARTGAGHDRVDAGVEALGAAVIREKGSRGAKPMTLDMSAVPADIKALMEDSNA